MLPKCFYLPLIAGLFFNPKNDTTGGTNVLEELVTRYYDFYNKFPQQKIYIHTDKPHYISGDEVYGKVYLINESKSGNDINRSKKIYVELIDEKNAVVKRTIVNGLYSSLNFHFHLNESIAEGNYILRAYTAWMLGFNNHNIFNNYIHISNKNNRIIPSLFYKDSTLSTVNVQLKDVLKDSYLEMPVYYELMYKNKLVAKEQVTTNNRGSFIVNVSTISKEFRSDASIKIKADSYEKTFRLPPSTNEIDVQFLPEGGNLVNGIENNVAFKAIDKWGHGTDVQGYVRDDKGVVVGNFKSRHLGMGSFIFIPESQRSYTAFVQSGKGKELSYPLFSANNYDYQVSVVERAKSEVRVRVALGDSLYTKNKISYLVATSHGGVYFTSHGVDQYEVSISLNAFPEGIAQITLFDASMQAVSERLLYVHHPYSNISVSANAANYRKREKIVLQLKTADVADKPLKGMYSISVTDDNVVKLNENDGNIKTHLLLSPYLKGQIEEPGYYFKNDDATTADDLDLLMLTHGWSRFKWSDIEDNTTIKTPEGDSTLSINGNLSNSKHTAQPGYTVSLFSASNSAFVGIDTTDANGKFHFKGIDYTDSTSFFIQIRNKKGVTEDGEVTIDPLNFPSPNMDKLLVPKEDNSHFSKGVNYYLRFLYDSLLDEEKIHMLKAVTVSSTVRKASFDESKRVSPTSYIITSDFIEKYGNVDLINVLLSVPGATFFNDHISFFGPNTMGKQTDPLYILDGIESPGAFSVNPYDIDFIEVLRGAEASIYGLRGGTGVVLINTKKGKDARVKFNPVGIKALQVPGYHVEKEFYSPKYETDESKLSKTKDARTTIYWNGNVHTDENGAATVSFYAADMPTTYTLTVEGIAQNGEVIHKTSRIQRTK